MNATRQTMKLLGKAQPNVPVFGTAGQILGHVSRSASSISAAKIAGGPVQFSRRFGVYGWVAK